MEKEKNESRSAVYCSPETMRRYPEALRGMPYCVWKYEEDAGGRPTKIPYNPRTGFRAAVDRAYSFADLDTALAALEEGEYSGVGMNISGAMGCIDVDHCIGEEGVLTETAEAVLAMLPEAWAEVSPSGTGLHLFFLMPEDWIYDTEEYYVNCNRYGLEIYLGGMTRRFMTMTGNLFREGNLQVLAEALDAFSERFMKRPEPVCGEIRVPEGGSILSDGEVLQKCYRARGGETFARYYSGDWTKQEDPNWSRSQADLSVCRRLAFFCRGDMEQMDRLMRESGLYREKWDARRGECTYGELTMRRAVSGCTSFYGPEYGAAEDFADLPADDGDGYQDGDGTGDEAVDEPGTEEEPCVVKAGEEDAQDGAAETGGNAARLDEYLARDSLSVEEAVSPELLELAAWAYREDLPRYAALKRRIPKELGIRRFEKEMKDRICSALGTGVPSARILKLQGCSTTGMIVPSPWVVDEYGVRYLKTVQGETVSVWISRDPVFVSAKVVSVDDESEKLELTFRRNGRYKKLTASRADLLNKNTIIRFADFGLPVSSGTTSGMTEYLAEMEAANGGVIPIKRCLNRAGWVGSEFYPYRIRDVVQYNDDSTGTTNLLEGLHTRGSEEAWMALATQARSYPWARLMLAASFASPLLNKLPHRNIYLHCWYESRGGKTAVLKLCLSVYGDPEKLIGTYNATLFGLEQRAATMKHLPLALDELQSLKEKYMSVNDVVYNLGNGVGKTRGKIGSGIRRIDGWNNVILSTGEQPMRAESSMDGINARLLEINACPLMNEEGIVDEELGIRLHTDTALNYGFAGKKYIDYLIDEILGSSVPVDGADGEQETLPRLDADYREILQRMGDATEPGCRSNPHFTNVAVIALGDFYSSLAVFGLNRDQAMAEAVKLGAMAIRRVEADRPQETIDAAWSFTQNWVAANSQHFTWASEGLPTTEAMSPILGQIERDKVYVLVSELNRALDDARFPHAKCIRGFGRKGYIDTFSEADGKRRVQTVKRIKGIASRVYVMNIRMGTEEPPVVQPETAQPPEEQTKMSWVDEIDESKPIEDLGLPF